jgi:fused signal recognition particle receptor
MGFNPFAKLKAGLKKTRDALVTGLRTVLSAGRKLDQDLIDEVEERLIAADMGPETALKITNALKVAYKEKVFLDAEGLYAFLKEELKRRLRGNDGLALRTAEAPPTVILVVGVNGTGKTTSVAKLAALLRKEGKSVILAAADTFRAAAVEQLATWSSRIGVDIVKGATGADPAAVVFDAIDAALARRADVLIVDTAGRLHTKENLMRELEKIRRVLEKKLPGAPHEVILVLDATTGQNAILQAKTFKEAVAVTGLFLAKLDGTAKGGVVVGIRDQIDIPVKYIGVGESPDDIEAFDPDGFVEALFAEES